LAVDESGGGVDPTGSALHIIHVGGVAPVYHPERHGYLTRYDELREEVCSLLGKQVERMEVAGGTVAQSHLAMERPDEEVVVLGERVGAGLIVVGSRGLGRIRWALMVSVSDSVVRCAHRPVLVVREK
jgi:nucleotide-binding universal stress UspA family protein